MEEFGFEGYNKNQVKADMLHAMSEKRAAAYRASISKRAIKHLKEILGDTKDVASGLAIGALLASGIGLSGTVSALVVASVAIALKSALNASEQESEEEEDKEERQND